MGVDKATRPLAGVPLATRAARRLDAVFAETLVVGAHAPPDAPGRRIEDPPGPPCALRGLVGALTAARAERVLVLATDLPLVTEDLLLALVAWPEADVVLPCPEGRPQPLCAVYRRTRTLELARARLASGHLALMGLLDELAQERLEEQELRALDPHGDAVLNANTPADWARAEARLAARARGE